MARVRQTRFHYGKGYGNGGGAQVPALQKARCCRAWAGLAALNRPLHYGRAKRRVGRMVRTLLRKFHPIRPLRKATTTIIIASGTRCKAVGADFQPVNALTPWPPSRVRKGASKGVRDEGTARQPGGWITRPGLR